jgi:hypothetical protein
VLVQAQVQRQLPMLLVEMRTHVLVQVQVHCCLHHCLCVCLRAAAGGHPGWAMSQASYPAGQRYMPGTE